MQLDGYTLGERLGRGATATVYAGHHDASGDRVAVKLFAASRALDARTRQRVQLELSALSRLEHEHLVRVRDSGEVDGRLYLVMDLVQGETLQARLDRDGPLDPSATRSLLRALAAAVDYAHRCGVVHRDIKPDNVLLADDGPRLTDFGLALDLQQEGERLTQTGVLMGTPGYLAPEQASGLRDDVGRPTDVYGLGGLLYACLTGGPPVGGATLQEILAATLQGQIMSPSALRAEVDPELEALCLACLTLEPAKRPTAEQLARRLSGSAAPARRFPWLPVLAILTLGLVLGGAWTLTRSDRAPTERIAECEQLLAHDVEALEPVARRLIADFPRDPRGHYYLAVLTTGEDWTVAQGHVERALALDPDYAEAWFMASRVYGVLEDDTAELRASVRAAELDPAEYLIYRATIYRKRGALAEAAADVRAHLRLSPDDWNAWCLLAEVLEAQERLEEAEGALDRAIAVAPEDQLWACYRSRCDLRRLRGDLEGALEDITAVAEANGEWRLSQVATRAALLTKLDRYLEAAAAYRQAVELYPESVTYTFNVYLLEQKLGRPEEARRMLDRAYELAQTRKISPELRRQVEEAWLEAHHR